MSEVIRDTSHRVKVALHGNLTRQVVPVQDPRGQTQEVPLYAIDHTPVVRAIDDLMRNIALAPDESVKLVLTAIPTKSVRHRSKIDRAIKAVKQDLLKRLLNQWWAVYDSQHDDYYFVKHFLGQGNTLFQVSLSGHAEWDGCFHILQHDLHERDGQLVMHMWDYDTAGEPTILGDRGSLREYLTLFTDLDGNQICTEAEFDTYFQADPLVQKRVAAMIPQLHMAVERPPQDLDAVL